MGDPTNADHAATDTVLGGGTAATGAEPAVENPSADHIAPRTRTASAPPSALATMIPSTMSAATATHGLPRVRTAMIEPLRVRRMDRSIPARRGGVRKPGTARSRLLATRPSDLAASANWLIDAVVCIPR